MQVQQDYLALNILPPQVKHNFQVQMKMEKVYLSVLIRFKFINMVFY